MPDTPVPAQRRQIPPRRVLALSLPNLALDRQAALAAAAGDDQAARDWRHGPAACHAPGPRGPVLTAISQTARDQGVRPGMTLAEARARLATIRLAPADPRGDRHLLARLADMADRFSPAVALDGGRGLLLDITGVAHLFGGEAALAARAVHLLSRQGRLTIRTAIAPGPLAASVLARHRQPSLIITPDGADAAAALAHAVGPLPIEAIVEDHPQAVQGLARLGIRRIDALNALPRQSVAERFGPDVIAALDRLYGRMADPLHPRRPPAAVEARISWAEPIGRAEDIAAATASLVDSLARDLATAGLGARQLLLSAHIVDGAVRSAELGLAMASRDPVHLMRLLAERLDRIDPGLGIEVMVLSAPRVQRQGMADRALPGLVSCSLPAGLTGRGQAVPAGQPVVIAALIDRIDARLGSGRVRAVQIDAAVLPEAVARLVSATGQAIGLDRPPTRHPAALAGPHRPTAPRPPRLLPRPEPVTVIAALPDDPPAQLRWRGRLHRVRLADGPERLHGPWWQMPGQVPGQVTETRDYYRIETWDGDRLWVFRAGTAPGLGADIPPTGTEEPGWFVPGWFVPGWFVHGIFP